jgi:hypothetical protein
MDHVRETNVSELEAKARRQQLVEKFEQTLAMARPQIGISPAALGAAHLGRGVEYRYRFSEVPFRSVPALAEQLERVLASDPVIDRSSRDQLRAALGDAQGVTRIDVFGSCPPYSPLVFDAVLEPAAEQWAAAGESGRAEFWRLRRARPLPAALPMGDEERRTMVAGWLLGLVVGRIRIPPAPYHRPVQVFDAAAQEWVPFPHPLLTPPQRFAGEHDWMPAVLESVLIAIARSHEAPVMGSLRPYQVLRRIYDSAPETGSTGLLLGDLAGRRALADWLAGTGRGGASSVAGVGPDSGAAERARLAIAWLAETRARAETHQAAPAEPRSRTPMARDVAPDVLWAVDRLVELIGERRAEPSGAPPPDAPGDGRVFLSYRREESRHAAGRIADRIGPDRVFMDVDTIEPGLDFARAIIEAVSSCAVLLALIGPGWLSAADRAGRRRLDDPDDFVVLEVATALDRGIRVVPVLLDGARMPTRDDLPEPLHPLTRRQSVRIDHETFSSDVAALLTALT